MGGQRGRRRRPCARGADSALQPCVISLEDAFQACKKPSTFQPLWPVTLRGTGAEGGAEPHTVPPVLAWVRCARSKGFFTVERTCPTCSGMGQIIKTPVNLAGQGRVEKDRSLLSTSLRVLKQAPAFAWQAKAKPACAVAVG